MPTSDIFTGQNDANLLASQQETGQSANNILQNNPTNFNNPNQITQPEAPKGLYGTVDSGQNINLDKTSYDYNAAFYDSTEAGLSKQYPGNFKLPDLLLPQSETKRFTEGQYGFDVNKNNETFYADHQGALKMFANSGANLVGKTAAYALQNLGFILGAPATALPGGISNMTDNFLVKAADRLKEGTEEDFPIYKSDKYQQGNIWQKLGTLGWWTDDAMDRIALTAAMFIPGLAEAKGLGLFGVVTDAAGGTRAVGVGAKAIQSLAENPENYGWLGKNFIKNLYKAAAEGVVDKGVSPALKAYAQNLGKAELYTWNVIGQSALNAKETQEAVMKATGDKDKATDAAMKSFWETVPLALAGSLVEIPQMFSTKATPKSIIGEVFDKETGELIPNALDLKSPSLGKTLMKAALTGFEHGQNESLQVAVSRYNEESAEGKDKRGTLSGIFGDFLDNIHDPNGQNNIALGTIQGILMTLGGRGIDKFKGKDASEQKQRLDVFRIINEAKLVRRYYNEDFATRDENGKVIVGTDGKVVKDQDKLANTGLSLAGVDSALELKKQAIKNKDYTTAALLDHKALAGFAYNFLADPKGMQHLINILQIEARDNASSPDRVNDVDESGQELTPQVQLQRNIAKIKEFKSVYDAIDQRHAGFTNLGIDNKNKEQVNRAAHFIESLKNAQYTEAANQLFLASQIDTNRKQIERLGVDGHPEFVDHETEIKDPSNPMEERFNDLVGQNKQLNNILDESKARYKALIDKKAQREGFDKQTELIEQVEKEAKEKQENQPAEEKEPTDAPAETTTPEDTTKTTTEAPTEEAVLTPEQEAAAEQKAKDLARRKEIQDKINALTDKRNNDLAAATTPEQKAAINSQYLKDRVAIMNSGLPAPLSKTPEEQEARFKQLKTAIPTGPNIHVDDHAQLNKIINADSKAGNINALHESLLLNALDQKKVIGTIFDTGKEIEDENSDKPVEEERPEEPTQEEVDQTTTTPTEDDPHIGDVGDDFNPDTNEVEDLEESDTFSYLAWRSSNKTVTQEEQVDENGQYNNKLDEDPYKQFKQGFFRYINNEGFPDNGIQAMIVQDHAGLPHSEQSKADIAGGVPYGSVLVLTDMDRNILYFDENYNSSKEEKEGSKPLVYSFNKIAWNKLEMQRALLGQAKTKGTISYEQFLEAYEREQKQQNLARQLAAEGKAVNVDIKAISKGVIKKASIPIQTDQVIKEDMNPRLFIPPSPIDAFDPENPTKNKYIIVGNQALLNGALYAQTTDQFTGLPSYTRTIPNKIIDTELHEEITELLNNSYDSENEAEIAKDYLKTLLFLDKAKRPTIKVGEGVEGKYIIRIIQDNITMQPEVAQTFVDNQRLNIQRSAVDTNEYVRISLSDGKLQSTIKNDYDKLILKNSTTRDIPIQTSKGSKYIPLNTYAIFDFLESPETMQARLGKEELEHPAEEIEQAPVKEVEIVKDNSTLTKAPLRKLKKLPTKETDATRIAREQDERDRGASIQAPPLLTPEQLKEFIDKKKVNKKEDVQLVKSSEKTWEEKKAEMDKNAPSVKELFTPGNKIMVNGVETNVVAGPLDANGKPHYIKLVDDKGNYNTNVGTNIWGYDSQIVADNFDYLRYQNIKGLKAKIDQRENRALLSDSEIGEINTIFGKEVAQRVNDIINSDARAVWTISGIKLYRDARVGDGYHEAWHHFSQLYLTIPEKKSLYNEVRKRAIDFTDRDGVKQNTKESNDHAIEEFIADDFRNYAEKEGNSVLDNRPMRNSIFRKILDFIKKFFFGAVNFNKLYNDLYTGNLNGYESSVNNAIWGNLNSRALTQSGDEIINNQKAAYYRGVVDYFMGDQLLKANTSVGQLRKNKALAKAIYENIYNDLVTNFYNPLLEDADAGKDINQEVAEDLFKILSNWEDFVQYHKQASKLAINIPEAIPIDVPDNPEDYSSETSIGSENLDLEDGYEELTGETPEERDAEYSDKMYDRAGNEQSSLEAASIETKSLIRMLPEISYNDGNFAIQIDRNGFPKLNDYAKTWNNLSLQISNLSEYGEMIEKMRDPEVMRKIPELSALLQHLPDPAKEHTPAELNTIIAFRTDFNRAYIGIYSGKISPNEDGTNTFFLNEETKRNKDQVLKFWTANFYNKLNTDPNVINGTVIIDDQTGKYYLNPAKPLAYNLLTPKGRNELLDLLGFTFSEDTKKQQFFLGPISQYLKNIQDSINLRNQAGQKVFNPIFDLRSDLYSKEPNTPPIVYGLRQTLDILLNLESKYSTEVPSLSYQTAEGEMIYGLSLNHTLSITSNKLNKARSYDDIVNDATMQHLNINNNPYVRGSIFLRALFNLETGKRSKVNLVVGNYNGLKTEDKDGNTVGYSTTSLNVRQKAIFDINSLLSKGVMEVMRTESSKSAYFIKLEYYHIDKSDPSKSYLPVGINEFTMSFQSPSFKGIMIDNYLYDELNRMQGAKDVEIYKKDAKLMTMAEGFNLFRDILSYHRVNGKNSEALKNKLKEEIETKGIQEVIQKYRQNIEDAIENYFQAELKSLKNGLQEENISENDLGKNIPGKSLDQKYRTFLANNFILNVEYTKLFNGDTIYQAHYKDYFKRSKGDISTKKSPIVDDLFARAMKQTEGNTFAAFAGSNVPNNYKTTKTINISDDERPSKYVEIYKKDLKALNPELTEEELDKFVDKYRNLNIGDGQGWVTLDFYRQFLKSINNWSDAQELMYKVELAQWRLAHADFNTEYTNEMKEQDRDFLREHPETYSYFPPLKIQYNGPIKAKGTAPMVMDKFSVVPLIPSVIQNTPLEDVHHEMLKHSVGYTKFMSGTKKYKAPGYSMYDENGYKGVDFSKADLPEHFLEYLGEQINTSPKIKTESIFGSQVRKLIEANIFSNGLATEKDLERHERYKSYIKGMVELGREQLFNDLSLRDNNGKMEINDVKKFISTLQSQADLRDLNDNIKDYIQYDKDTNKMKYPLETSLNRKAIQDLIMGIVDRRLRVQKLSGDQLIQISSSGFQSKDFKYTNATEEEIKKYGTNGLGFYHLEYDADGKPVRTKAAQVKVGLNGSFEKLLLKNHPDGNKIGTIERLNELLKDDKWMEENRKSVTLVGYRIPTQGHNSIEYMEVAEFLPPHVGSSIIVPAEIVAKAGSDFDIDKLSIFRPSFDDNGEIINDKSKEGYANKIIDLFSEILSDPKTFTKLIRPNDTDLIKGEVNQIAVAIGKRTARDIADPRPYSGTQIYRYRSSLRKFETLLSAKRLLSIFAVNNTFTTLMQQAGVSMNTIYRNTDGYDRQVRMMLLSPEERAKIVVNGRINLGDKYAVDGTLKQDILNQLINATVDAASDDFFGYVNASYENVNVLCHLINQGVPFDRAMWFLNQPSLLRYYSDLRRRGVNDSKSDIQAKILGGLTNTNFYIRDEEGKEKLDRDAFNEMVNELLNGRDGTKMYLSMDVLKMTTVKSSQVDEFLDNEVNKSYNAVVFAYFLSLQEQAQLFRNFQTLMNYDTTKTRSPLSSWQAFQAMTNLKTNKMFDETQIKKMEDNSIIAPFDQRKLIATIGARLMPVAFNPYFMAQVTPMITRETQFKTKPQQKKYISNFENQWIEYVVKTMSSVDGNSLSSYTKYLLEGRNNLARRFNDLISKYPNLKQDYSFVSRIRPNFPNRPDIKKSNLEVYRLFENSTDDQNRYISEFRELINLDNPRQYTPTEALEIRQFFTDVAILGFVQSGFSKSNISFQELVPYEQMADMFKTAIQNLNRYVLGDKELMNEYVKEFTQQFGNLNTAKATQQWRGRDYYRTEKIATQIAKKSGKINIIKHQVPTNSEPAPFENVIKPQTVADNLQDQQQLDLDNQQKLLSPDVKTDRQYWPGEEVNGNEMEEALGKAEFKSMMDKLDNSNIDYANVDLNIKNEELEEIINEGEIWERLNSGNFNDAIKVVDRFKNYHSSLFLDEYGDDMTLDKLKDQLRMIALPDGESSWTEVYGGIKSIFKQYQEGSLNQDEMDSAEKILEQYGLLRYRDYNPNQLIIPFKGTDAETYNKQINEVLNKKDKC